MEIDVSRRRFLAGSGLLGGTAWLRLTSPALAAITASACSARDAGSPFKSLTETEAGEISAIAARLIPTTDTPGATEAGVVHFFDQAFAGEMRGQLERFRSGLSGFLAAVGAEHPGQSFSELPPDAKDAFLSTQEGSDFFEAVWAMTMYGFFAMPSHGGNRDHVGWKLIGFEGHGAWTHPFGYYDGEVAGNGR